MLDPRSFKANVLRFHRQFYAGIRSNDMIRMSFCQFEQSFELNNLHIDNITLLFDNERAINCQSYAAGTGRFLII